MDALTSFDQTPNTNSSGATVFIVDDDADTRRALALIVRSAGYDVEAYASANEFLDRYDPQKKGCLVLDIRMPGLSGIELQQHLNGHDVRPPIIFVTGYGEVSVVTQAIRAGAVDVIAKPFGTEALVARIHEAVRLDLANREKAALRIDVRQRVARLTDREREIMRLLAAGESPKQIGTALSISPKTVDNHRAKILEKMSVDNPTQLAHLLSVLD